MERTLQFIASVVAGQLMYDYLLDLSPENYVAVRGSTFFALLLAGIAVSINAVRRLFPKA